jgi:hypothetical protein
MGFEHWLETNLILKRINFEFFDGSEVLLAEKCVGESASSDWDFAGGILGKKRLLASFAGFSEAKKGIQKPRMKSLVFDA